MSRRLGARGAEVANRAVAALDRRRVRLVLRAAKGPLVKTKTKLKAGSIGGVKNNGMDPQLKG